jgi:hypothetical protein
MNTANSNKRPRLVVRVAFALLGILLVLPNTPLCQEVIFADDFEDDLSGWESNAFGQLVADPLDVDNMALAFSQTNVAGDLFSPTIDLEATTAYVFEFKYLGNAGGAETGGFLWLYDAVSEYPGSGNAVAWSTQPVGVDDCDHELVDDGEWHLYQLTFTPSELFDLPVESLKIALEDWSGAASGTPPPNIAGDALFDDVRFYELGAVRVEQANWGMIKSIFK